MLKIKEVFVVVENRPGTVGQLCQELARRKINIEAIGVFGDVAKLWVSNTQKALKTLSALGYEVEEREVLAAELENQPGALAKLALALGEAGVNIEYCYGTMSPGQERGVVILDVSDINRALEVMGK
ncbi:MAG: ACT domain-containing protein [Calditrichaeota bacterium]|nr:ACT domain-containing protein [Calditrichota bacterium]